MYALKLPLHIPPDVALLPPKGHSPLLSVPDLAPSPAPNPDPALAIN